MSSETAGRVPVPADEASLRSELPQVRRHRDRNPVVDVVVLASTGSYVLMVLLLDAAADGGEVLRQPPWDEVWLDLSLGVASVVALWWRRRFPVLLGVAAAFVATISAAVSAAAFVMLLTVAVHRRWPWALLVGGANVVATMLFMLWSSSGVRSATEWAVVAGFAVLLTVVPIAFGMAVRARRQLVVSLRERARRAETEQRLSALAARHGERTRIAREMHDVLAHRMSLVSMHAGALEYLRDASPEEVATAAGVIRENAHHALEELRDVIGVLRSEEEGTIGDDGTSTSRPQPTLEALDGLLQETRAAGISVQDDVQLSEEPIPFTTSRTAYRVLQEGLTNARKHGRGAAVTVYVHGRPGDGLCLEVRNPLRPGSPPGTATDSAVAHDWSAGLSRRPSALPIPGSGAGLIGVAERTRLAGGRSEHGVVDDAFRLRAWLPWRTEDTT